jgi:hypothetical protein
MGSARRLYVYLVAAVSLLALASGVYLLLATVLRTAEDTLAGSAVLGDWASREQLSLAIALIAVGGPVFALHWWLARRGLGTPGPRGDEERGSAIRAGYVALVQAVALGFGLVGVVSLLAIMLGRVFGVTDPSTWSDPLATVLVALPVWAFHARGRAAEIRLTRMTGAAAYLTRLYRYGGMFASLLVLLVGAFGLVATVLSILVGRQELGSGDWWRTAAAGQVAGIVAGLGAWLLHWRDADAAIRDADRIGEDERLTRLRTTYFGGVLLVTLSWTAAIATGALADLGRWILGTNTGDTVVFLEQVVGPPLAVAPVILVGAWHAWVATREAAALGGPRVVSTRRNGLLAVSLVGLSFLVVGGVQLVELAISQLAATGEPSLVHDRTALNELPWCLAALLVGAVLWLPAWAGILGMRTRDPAVERAAPAMRAYLFLVVGAATVAAVPTATMTLYQVLVTILGGEAARPLLAELAFPIAVVFVAVLVGAYHLRLLLADLRAGAAAGVESGEAGGRAPVATAAIPAAAPMPAELTVALTLHAPVGTDMTALLGDLRDHLPPGAVLDGPDGREVPDGRDNLSQLAERTTVPAGS